MTPDRIGRELAPPLGASAPQLHKRAQSQIAAAPRLSGYI